MPGETSFRQRLKGYRTGLERIEPIWANWASIEEWIAGFQPFLRRHFPEDLTQFDGLSKKPTWQHLPSPSRERDRETDNEDLVTNNALTEQARANLLAFLDALLEAMPEPASEPPPQPDVAYMPFRPYKRFAARIQNPSDILKSLQIAAFNSSAEEEELARFGGRHAVLASIFRHMPTFDPAEANEPHGPAWLKLKPVLVRAGLKVDENTTLSDIRAFLDATTPVVSTAQQTGAETTMPDPKRVFVIYGRNRNAYDQMVKFLRALKLDPKGFYDLSADCGANATVLQVVLHGMELAAGVVAMFTADEWAVLRPTFNRKGDQNKETQRWQARPNVIFEAGLALGIAEQRTVLVTVGRDVRLFSDAGGIHLVNLDNGYQSRNLLRGKLKTAGCQPDMETGDHLETAQAGDFEGCVNFTGEQAPANPFRPLPRRKRGSS